MVASVTLGLHPIQTFFCIKDVMLSVRLDEMMKNWLRTASVVAQDGFVRAKSNLSM